MPIVKIVPNGGTGGGSSEASPTVNQPLSFPKNMDLNQRPHRRYNALTGDWILVSPHRTKRPWQGKQESSSLDARPAHDPRCYLCAGNERAGGISNPDYKGVYVFDNDYAAILPDEVASGGDSGDGLLL